MDNKSCFIMGLPEAGKTTFLAALWYCLESTATTYLKIRRYGENHQYLSDIGQKWAGFQVLPRTLRGAEEARIALLLRNSHGDAVDISFPDLSGESFQNQYVDREIDVVHAELVKQSMGVLLFINPNRLKEPQLIADISPELRNGDVVGLIPYATRNMRDHDPTPVQLVELLQFVGILRGRKPINLGVVLSAWDTIKHLTSTPQEYVKARLSLLWQYACANKDLFNTFYYGVSAQGGLLEDPRLWNVNDPVERILVVDDNGNRSHDITAPLAVAVGEVNV